VHVLSPLLLVKAHHNLGRPIRVHVLVRTALVTRRHPEVGDYPVHRRTSETTWNREVGGVPSRVPSPFPPRADGSGPFAIDGLIGDAVSAITLATIACRLALERFARNAG
jgi:hypothetical protein